MFLAPRQSAVLLGLALLAPAASAFAPHPSILTVKYKGKMYPVVSYLLEQCVANVDGKEKSLWRPEGYALKDAAGYGDNFVEAGGAPLGGPVVVQNLGGPHQYTATPDEFTLHVTLTARKSIKGGFTVVGLYSSAQFSGPTASDNRPQLIIGDLLRPLPAGQPTHVEISLGSLHLPKEPHYFVLIFNETGQEVMTSGSQYAWEYFALCDRARLKIAQKMYLQKFPGSDHAAVPAIMPKPIFPPGTAQPTGEIQVTITVEADGHVSDVDASQVQDAKSRQALTDALGGWLFLPKLKAGVPVPTKIRVPLQF